MKTGIASVVLSICGVVCCAGLMQGCATDPTERQRTEAGLRTEVHNVQEDMNKINGRLDQLDRIEADLRQETKRLNAADIERAAAEKRIAALEMQIKAIDAAREADKKEMIDKLSQKIAEVINRSTSVEPPQGNGGRATGAGASGGKNEHVVKQGESLSTIAHQYGVTVDSMVKANQLKDANRVRIGQALIIPR